MDNGITKITPDALKEQMEADYTDGDIIILDDLREIPMEGSLQMDMILVIICTEGKLQVDMNGKTFTTHTGDMFICPPNVYLDNYMISPNFNSKIMGLSYSYLQRMLSVNRDIWDMILYLTQNPIYHLTLELQELFNAYYSLISLKLNRKKEIFQKEVFRALFQAVFYDLFSVLSPLIADECKDDGHAKQGDHIVKRFLRMLSDSQGKERSVTAYAQRLCITPKYLTTVCKASSGKTALEWIHEYTMDIIVQQLKYSEHSIKEISDGLDFPNISFFGKFVKARIGMSPTEYRKQWVKENK